MMFFHVNIHSVCISTKKSHSSQIAVFHECSLRSSFNSRCYGGFSHQCVSSFYEMSIVSSTLIVVTLFCLQRPRAGQAIFLDQQLF
jgi:hypothetical protein